MSTSSSSGSPVVARPRWEELQAIAPLATVSDAIDGLVSTRMVAPENESQLSAILSWANEHEIHVIARGGGSKMNWGNLPRAVELLVSLEKLQGVVEHAWQDMTVTVQAGTRIAALQTELAKHGQRLPLDALWPERSTIGGVVATNDSGPLRLRFGSVRDLILGVTVVLANGTIARSGGRVVKNVAGYDLPKLFTGSFGTLGVITEVTMRTYPLPHASRTISFQFGDVEAAGKYMLAVADTTLVPAGMQLRVAAAENPVVDICFEGLSAGIAAQVERATQLASAAQPLSVEDNLWNSREIFWDDATAIIGKFSLLPSVIADGIREIQSRFSNSRICVQSLGLGIFCADADLPALLSLRDALRRLGGTLIILHAPREIKTGIDVFGELSTAYPLMVRTKQQFDPKGILSPGRFLGGI